MHKMLASREPSLYDLYFRGLAAVTSGDRHRAEMTNVTRCLITLTTAAATTKLRRIS